MTVQSPNILIGSFQQKIFGCIEKILKLGSIDIENLLQRIDNSYRIFLVLAKLLTFEFIKSL